MKENKALCIICYDEKPLFSLKNCKHRFCRDCLFIWNEKKGDCPLCRTKIENLYFILTRHSEKRLQKKIYHRIVDFFEKGDEFSIPEIIDLYERIHHYSYSLYRKPEIKETMLINNGRILKQLQVNDVMRLHPKRAKLEKILKTSNELCNIFSNK